MEESPTGLAALEEYLEIFARSVYPVLTGPETDGPISPSDKSTVDILVHPLQESFQILVMKDTNLACLFPEESESNGRQGNAARSTGRMHTIQLSMFASGLVASGWRLARSKTLNPTREEVVESVLEGLTTVRKALNGEEAFVPARVGLAGVLLPEGLDQIELGWATIRKTDARDDQFVDTTSLGGQLTTENSDGQTVVINYSGDLVLELNFPFFLQVGGFDMPTQWPEELEDCLQELWKNIQNVRLGLLLACPETRPIVVSTWQAFLDPLAHGSTTGWADASQTPHLFPIQLSDEQASEWRVWARDVGALRIDTIGVAVRRMLASIAERRSHEDVLVDAVIVWENLFGAKTETTHRVSSSLAWLLGTSAEDRGEKQTRYKKIYGFRSGVVHGAAKVNPAELREFSTEAVQISIQALRAIFSTHAELLKTATSEERSNHILLKG